MWGRVVAFVALGLLLAPSVHAQGPVTECREQCRPRDADVNGPSILDQPPVRLVLYGHFPSGGQAQPVLYRAPVDGFLNTQPVDPLREPDHRVGGGLPSLGGAEGIVFTMTSLSSLLEMGRGGWVHHSERGLSAPVLLAGSPTVYLYLSADGGVEDAPYIVPRLNVGAELRRGTPLRAGSVVAESSGNDVQVTLVNDGTAGEDVYEVKVTLRTLQPSIPYLEGNAQANRFFVKIRIYQLAEEGLAASQAEWRFHTGARFPPRLVLPVFNPLEHGGLDVDSRTGDLFVQWRVRSPLGSYDVDPASFRIRLQDLNATRTFEADPVRIDHDPHQADALVLWRIPRDLLLQANPWVINVSAANLQGTYRLTEGRIDQPLVVFANATTTVPSLGAAFGLLALLAAFALSRPRR